MSDVATMLSAEDPRPVADQEVVGLTVEHEEPFELVDKPVSVDAGDEQPEAEGQLSSAEADHSPADGVPEAHDAPASEPVLLGAEPLEADSEGEKPEAEVVEAEAEEEPQAPDAQEGAEEEPAVEEVDTGPVHPSKLYFVRYPKPDLSDLDIEIEKVKAVFASYKEGFEMILATLKVQQVNQSEAKRELDAATEVFEASAEEQRKWRDELAPLRNADKIVSERRFKMRDNVKDLPARSEAELDAKIQELEFTLDHTTIPRAQEDKLIKEISRLSKSRPEVRKIEAEFAAVESSKEQLSEFAASKQELEKKVSIIAEEVTQAKEVRQERWLVLSAIRDKVTLLSNEMKAMRAQKDEQWGALNKLRDARKRKLDVYYANRRFSQTVRQQLAGGQIQEAVDACAELNARVIGKLVEDAEFRAEYTELWEMQRTYAVSQASIELDPTPAKGKKAVKPVPNGTASSGKDKAARIIEELLLEADRELGKAPPSTGSATRSSLLTSGPATTAHKSTNGSAAKSAPAEPATDKPTPVARSAPKAKAPAPAPVRAVRELEAFELPEAISQPAAEQASAAHAKAAVQAEQRAKAAESARKKQEKEDAKVRKAQKALEAAQTRQDAEAAKAQAQEALVKRNAAEQRAKAAKKKEAEARRLEKMALQKQTRTMRTKEAPASKPRPSKATMVTKAQKMVKDNWAATSAALGVGAIGVVMMLAYFA